MYSTDTLKVQVTNLIACSACQLVCPTLSKWWRHTNIVTTKIVKENMCIFIRTYNVTTTTHLLIYCFWAKKVKAHLVPIPTSGMP